MHTIKWKEINQTWKTEHGKSLEMHEIKEKRTNNGLWKENANQKRMKNKNEWD